MTIFNAGLAAGAGLLGYLRLFFGWQILIIVFTFMTFIAIVILKFFKANRDRDYVGLLENNNLLFISWEIFTKSRFVL